jgi:hypothetical protein
MLCSTNQDPIFSNYSLPSGNEPGYPGGIFDPLGYSKGQNLEVPLLTPFPRITLTAFTQLPLLSKLTKIMCSCK